MSTAVRTRRPVRTPYLLLIPAIAILLLGMGYPVIWQFVTSTQEYGLAQQFGKPAPFVGLGNYFELATDSGLWAVGLVMLLAGSFIGLVVVLTVAERVLRRSSR